MKARLLNVGVVMLADAVNDAIADIQAKVFGVVIAVGGTLIAVLVLWLGFALGAKWVRKMGREMGMEEDRARESSSAAIRDLLGYDHIAQEKERLADRAERDEMSWDEAVSRMDALDDEYEERQKRRRH